VRALAVACVVAALGAGSAGAAPTAPTPPWIVVQGNHFVDTRIEQRVVLRGFDTPVSMSAAQTAVSLGANMVRIPVPWSSIEPTAPVNGVHQWAEDKLAQLDQVVQYYEQHNVQVLIDFHQVHWSPYFGQVCQPNTSVCGAGQGIPAWYYADGRFPQTVYGVLQAQAAWFTTEAKATVADYSAFADMMVARYSAFPNVAGFEIMNEPQGGALSETMSARALTATMLQWQLRVAVNMREVEHERALFISVRGGGEGLGTVDLSPLTPVKPIVLDFHDFFNGISNGGFDDSGDNWAPSWKATHNQFVTDYAGTLASQQRVLMVAIRRAAMTNVPLFVGEWGARWDDVNGAVYQSQMLKLFDTYGVSWTRWILNTSDRFRLLVGNTASDQALQVGAALALPPTRTEFDGMPLLAITRFGVRPRRFSEATTISTRISRPAIVDVIASRYRGSIVRHVFHGFYVHPGRTLSIVWKRRNDAGRDVDPGFYVLRMDVTNTRGEHVWHTALVDVTKHPRGKALVRGHVASLMRREAGS
jgi:cellulase (glycosyl hydrolase family 5)